MSNFSQNELQANKLKGKKILYLVTQSKWGGAQKYVLDLTRHLQKQNEVHIAYGKSQDKNSEFLKQCEKLGSKTIEIPYLVRDIDLGKDYLAMIDIYKLLNKENYNLIHLNSSKAGLLGALAAKLYNSNPMNIRVRVVYTAHGYVFNEPLPNFKKQLYTMSEKFSSGMDHLIITVSEADRQLAIEKKISHPKKIFTIHNGLDFSQYNFWKREEALEKLNLKNDKKYIATIASFYKTKGYPYLVEAVKLLRAAAPEFLSQYQFVFIGDGPELANIKAQVKTADLESAIKFLGEIPDAHQYLKAFDLFVLPSVKEGLPYTILEAGLARIPVIASKVGGIPEIIEDKKTGLLTAPANPLALKDAIKNILSDKNLADNLAEKNEQNIRTNFSLNKTLSETEKLYSKLF